ncbi:hypothetical protein J6590_030309 [Homalodisca vitripennis]|nr:hypothetical protein J6590_098927 [Homalodisca vitripennis]KAG8292850.1 hypothetical protein J6590_030309 [Homalodisca vitripennis]
MSSNLQLKPYGPQCSREPYRIVCDGNRYSNRHLATGGERQHDLVILVTYHGLLLSFDNIIFPSLVASPDQHADVLLLNQNNVSLRSDDVTETNSKKCTLISASKFCSLIELK